MRVKTFVISPLCAGYVATHLPLPLPLRAFTKCHYMRNIRLLQIFELLSKLLRSIFPTTSESLRRNALLTHLNGPAASYFPFHQVAVSNASSASAFEQLQAPFHIPSDRCLTPAKKKLFSTLPGRICCFCSLKEQKSPSSQQGKCIVTLNNFLNLESGTSVHNEPFFLSLPRFHPLNHCPQTLFSSFHPTVFHCSLLRFAYHFLSLWRTSVQSSKLRSFFRNRSLSLARATSH